MKYATTLLVILLASCTTVSERYQIDVQKKEDIIEILRHDDSLIVTITSSSGIGSAEIHGLVPTLKDAYTRFKYTSGNRFNNLEGFAISTDEYTCDLSLRVQAMRADCCEIDNKSKCIENTRKEVQNYPFKLDYEFLEVPLPREIIERGPKSIRLGWIDAFRG